MKFPSFAYALAAIPAFARALPDSCQPFPEIYADGTELCEKMFSNAFVVVDDDQPGYHMWFFDTDNNPNDEVTRQIFGQEPVEECNVQYFHKELPSAEGDDMRECLPWKQRSCCHGSTVGSPEEMKQLYGSSWDRCGTMSAACDRFFLYELCFYECEPSVGLFRRFNDTQTDHPDFNTWQLYQMPVKKSYCDAWFDACKHDYFSEERFSTIPEERNPNKLGISLGVIGSVAFLLCVFSTFLVHRERAGNPVFVAEKANPVA